MRHYILDIAVLAIILSQKVTAVGIPSEDDIATMTGRRINKIIRDFTVSTSKVISWESSLTSSGIWSDIDMSAGCGARISNWPATEHLTRTRSLAAAYVSNPDITLFSKIDAALNYWFAHDFTEPDCFDSGGVPEYSCPCGTPGLWNKNWFDQSIAIPQYVGDICLLIKNQLTPLQRSNCTHIQLRSYATINRGIRIVSAFTGANLLDIASIGISLGLMTQDADTLRGALDRFYSAVSIVTTVSADGIQPDGSFMQHSGLLYDGNYGNVFIGDLISVFLETLETSVAPDVAVQSAFRTLLDGAEWMIIGDAKLKKILWQYSAIGRMISFKSSDGQASGGVHMNIADIETSVQGWGVEDEIDEITERLLQPTTETANQGNLVGTRYFYNADYMVHRAPTYVVAFKMYSTRTINSECLNVQNPFGFHLSDGVIYNYLSGDEYVDVFGAWDWELVPGITVDYGGTPLTCKTVRRRGKRDFVGGATDENTGIAVFDFLNPNNANLAFKKTVFFFPSGYAVQVASVSSKNTTAPLVTVLDQRRRNGDIYINGVLRNTNTDYTTDSPVNSVWHDRIGYYFPRGESIHIDSKPKSADWSKIGISRGTTVDQLWTSYIRHGITSTTGLLSQYIVLPNIDASVFSSSVSDGKMPLSLDFSASLPQVNAAYSSADKSIAVAFWTNGTYTSPWGVTFFSDSPCVLLFRSIESNTYRLTVSDPSHLLTTIKVRITVNKITLSETITLPTGVKAGRGVVKSMVYF